MGLRPLAIFALAIVPACVRLGYDGPRAAVNPTLDAGSRDAAMTQAVDGAVADAASPRDTPALDASMPVDAAEAGAADASAQHDAGAQTDAAKPTATDDGGTTDAAVSSSGACAFSVVTNAYIGDPHYHGSLVLQNTGATDWTTPTIHFALASSTRVCNDADQLPGSGWSLKTTGNQCDYTRTSKTPTIAPGDVLDLEYSTDDPNSASSASAVTNVSVTGCP